MYWPTPQITISLPWTSPIRIQHQLKRMKIKKTKKTTPTRKRRSQLQTRTRTIQARIQNTAPMNKNKTIKMIKTKRISKQIKKARMRRRVPKDNRQMTRAKRRTTMIKTKEPTTIKMDKIMEKQTVRVEIRIKNRMKARQMVQARTNNQMRTQILKILTRKRMPMTNQSLNPILTHHKVQFSMICHFAILGTLDLLPHCTAAQYVTDAPSKNALSTIT